MWGFTKVIHFFIIIRHALFNVFIVLFIALERGRAAAAAALDCWRGEGERALDCGAGEGEGSCSGGGAGEGSTGERAAGGGGGATNCGAREGKGEVLGFLFLMGLGLAGLRMAPSRPTWSAMSTTSRLKNLSRQLVGRLAWKVERR
jgi:hypothetical protein